MEARREFLGFFSPGGGGLMAGWNEASA